MTKTQTAQDRTRPLKMGHVSLSEQEKAILSWSREHRLSEFLKVNEGIERQVLESKLLFIDTMAIDNGEILEALRTNPKMTWELVRDMFLGGPVDGYTSTFHGLEDINYPEHYWKAIIENEREKLLNS